MKKHKIWSSVRHDHQDLPQTHILTFLMKFSMEEVFDLQQFIEYIPNFQ